jgi:DNA-binding response OmpR family regulator
MPRRPKHWKHRVLYVGHDHVLTSFLKDALGPLDGNVIRSPCGRLSYCLIESEMPYIGGSAIKYSLFLFDEVLPDMTGKELAKFTRSIWHRKCTPILIVKQGDDWERLLSEIMRLLG